MYASLTYNSSHFSVRALRLGQSCLLFVPPVLLLFAGATAPGPAARLLSLGAMVLGLAAAGLLLARPALPDGLALPAILLHVAALGWLLVTGVNLNTPAVALGRGVLLLVPLALFAVHWLRQSGAPSVRYARCAADRLAHRYDLPADHATSRTLADVQELRRALGMDASPALAHLGNPRPEVRVAMLAGLEMRPTWKPGQAGLLLHLAQQTLEPDVRAAAVLALGACQDRPIVEPLSEFLCDGSPVVRLAAVEALLSDTGERWAWMRHACRLALAHPANADDGPLLLEGQELSPEAVADLTAWAAEKGHLALRAAQTLGAHYNQVLAAGSDPILTDDLRRQLAEPHTPAMLRLELARVLYHYRELEGPVLRQLIDPAAPAPLRLIGVEALLAEGQSVEAVAALHELARLPNREIALATAEVVQRRLHVELGLPRDGSLPPVQSRLAAEVARRLLQWSSQAAPAPEEAADSPHDDSGWRTMNDF